MDPVVVADMKIDEATWSKHETIRQSMERTFGQWIGSELWDCEGDGADAVAGLVARGALAALTFVRGYLLASGYRRIATGHYRVWVGFHNSELSFEAIGLIASMVLAAADDALDNGDFDGRLRSFWGHCSSRHPDYQARILMEGARAADIPVQPGWARHTYWQFGWGCRSSVTFESSVSGDEAASQFVLSDKHGSKELMTSLGLPTPVYALVESEADISAAIESVGLPCVTKPLNRGGGKGVTAGLNSVEDVRSGYQYARQVSAGRIMVEGFVEGGDYRLTVIDGVLRGAIRRERPLVVGDGHSTIRELVGKINASRPAASLVASGYLRPIRLDGAAAQHLASQGFSLETVLADGQEATVRSNANVSTGGTCCDVMAIIHPEIRSVVESFALTLGVRAVGFDYLTRDISAFWDESGGAFIELNRTPGIDALILAGLSPAEAGLLLLGSQPGRIPLDLVIVPPDVIARAREHFGSLPMDASAGWASSDIAFLGRARLRVRQDHPWAGVRTLLGHRGLTRAYVVASSHDVCSYGLPVDRADKVWVCDGCLDDEWLEVARRRSREPAGLVAWCEFEGIAGDLASGPLVSSPPSSAS